MQESSLKPTNPKDFAGTDRLPLHLVPDTLVGYASLAFLEGALKYGQYNWRVAGVRASVYVSAARRHLAKWFAGEWSDKKTQVPHLASALACIGIIVDSHIQGNLIDDRPPASPFGNWCDGQEKTCQSLRQYLGPSYTPVQWTNTLALRKEDDRAKAEIGRGNDCRQPPEERIRPGSVEGASGLYPPAPAIPSNRGEEDLDRLPAGGRRASDAGNQGNSLGYRRLDYL